MDDVAFRRRWLTLGFAAAAAVAICVIDAISPFQGAIATLYFAIPLLLAAAWGRRMVIGAAFGCAAMAVAAFAVDHWRHPDNAAAMRLIVSLIAIAIATLLALRDRSARTSLNEQARILEFTHDTVIIRDANDTILHWNDGAERLYGYSRAEAIGQRCDALLQCAFPSEEVGRSLAATGQWSGEMMRTRRDGRRIVLASRWLQRRDTAGGAVGIMETSADVTDKKHADEERLKSERRYSAIFHAAGFATWESDWSHVRRYVLDAAAGVEGDLHAWLVEHPDVVREAARKAVIHDVNQAAVSLFAGKGPEDLVGTSIVGRYPPGGERGFADILAGLASGVDVVEAETTLSTLDGRAVDVVLRATLVPDGEPWSRALIMAFDETERKEARAKLEQVSVQLAHAARVSTLGQLAASIAHEVNQPLTAIVTYGKSGKRWLSRTEPDIAEAIDCLDNIVSNGSRAADVIARVRSLARNAAPQAEPIDLHGLLTETISLVEREAVASGVILDCEIAQDLPHPLGDRVQIQQVVMNLLMNGIHAMRGGPERPGVLSVVATLSEDAMVQILVRDRGSGIAGDDPMDIFKPFFTTKSDGMGMGLSICRSIIEGHGGRIFAANNADVGASIGFTLPRSENGAVAGAQTSV